MKIRVGWVCTLGACALSCQPSTNYLPGQAKALAFDADVSRFCSNHQIALHGTGFDTAMVTTWLVDNSELRGNEKSSRGMDAPSANALQLSVLGVNHGYFQYALDANRVIGPDVLGYTLSIQPAHAYTAFAIYQDSTGFALRQQCTFTTPACSSAVPASIVGSETSIQIDLSQFCPNDKVDALHQIVFYGENFNTTTMILSIEDTDHLPQNTGQQNPSIDLKVPLKVSIASGDVVNGSFSYRYHNFTSVGPNEYGASFSIDPGHHYTAEANYTTFAGDKVVKRFPFTTPTCTR
jgi:hypothetical protein